MSKDEAFKLALSRYSWFYRRKMLRNINNGLGLDMFERVAKTADSIYRWSNHYSKEWL